MFPHSMAIKPFFFFSLWPTIPILVDAATTTTSASTHPVVTVVPACAQGCFQSFLEVNEFPNVCGSTPSLQCLCARYGSTGFTVGEGAVQCIAAEGTRKGCSSDDSSQNVLARAYAACSGQQNAVVPTHKTIIATLIVPTGLASTSPVQVVRPTPTTLVTASKPSNLPTQTLTNLPLPGSENTSSNPTNSSSPSSSSASSTRLNAAQIAGISIGAVAGLFLLVALVICARCARRRRLENAEASGPTRGFSKMRDSWSPRGGGASKKYQGGPASMMISAPIHSVNDQRVYDIAFGGDAHDNVNPYGNAPGYGGGYGDSYAAASIPRENNNTNNIGLALSPDSGKVMSPQEANNQGWSQTAAVRTRRPSDAGLHPQQMRQQQQQQVSPQMSFTYSPRQPRQQQQDSPQMSFSLSPRYSQQQFKQRDGPAQAAQQRASAMQAITRQATPPGRQTTPTGAKPALTLAIPPPPPAIPAAAALPAANRDSVVTEFAEDGEDNDSAAGGAQIWRPPATDPQSATTYFVADKWGNWSMRNGRDRRSRMPAEPVELEGSSPLSKEQAEQYSIAQATKSAASAKVPPLKLPSKKQPTQLGSPINLKQRQRERAESFTSSVYSAFSPPSTVNPGPTNPMPSQPLPNADAYVKMMQQSQEARMPIQKTTQAQAVPSAANFASKAAGAGAAAGNRTSTRGGNPVRESQTSVTTYIADDDVFSPVEVIPRGGDGASPVSPGVSPVSYPKIPRRNEARSPSQTLHPPRGTGPTPAGQPSPTLGADVNAQRSPSPTAQHQRQLQPQTAQQYGLPPNPSASIAAAAAAAGAGSAAFRPQNSGSPDPTGGGSSSNTSSSNVNNNRILHLPGRQVRTGSPRVNTTGSPLPSKGSGGGRSLTHTPQQQQQPRATSPRLQDRGHPPGARQQRLSGTSPPPPPKQPQFHATQAATAAVEPTARPQQQLQRQLHVGNMMMSSPASPDSYHSGSSSLLAKRLGAEKAAGMNLEAAGGGSGVGARAGWSRHGGPGGGAGEPGTVVVPGMGHVPLPSTPGWQPKLTPTRRGDDLFLSVG